MNNRELPAKNDGTYYFLNGSSLKRWNKFWLAEASGFCLCFLIAYPIFAGFAYWLMAGTHPTPEEFKKAILVLAAGMPAVIGVIAVFISTAKSHAKRALSFQINEDSLVISTWPHKETLLRWQEINAIFLSDAKEYVICTKDNEYFFPQDMESASFLFAQVNERIRQNPSDYEVNFALADGWRQKTYFGLVVILGSLHPIFHALLQGQKIDFDWQGTATLVFILLLGLYIYVVNIAKAPRILRAGSDGLYIRDNSGEDFINWDDVSSLSRFGSSRTLHLKSRQGSWFIPWTSFSQTTGNKADRYAAFESVFHAKERLQNLAKQRISSAKETIT